MSLSVDPPLALAAATILPSLCGIAVGTRFYIRRAQRLDCRIDDWLTVPPLAFTIGMGIAMIYGVAVKGFAYPTLPRTDAHEGFTTSNHVVTVAWCFLLTDTLCLGFVKLSFVFFYRRIFAVGHRSRAFNRLTILVNILTVIWMIAFFFAIMFECSTHFEALWTSEQAVISYCPNISATLLSFSISDFVTDLVIFLLPIPVVWKLQMPLRRRLQTIAAFSVGGVAVVASILRMVAFIRADQRKLSEPICWRSQITMAVKEAFHPRFDYQLVLSTAVYWSLIELALALIAACLPTMSYFFRRPSPATTSRSNKGPPFSQLREDSTQDSVLDRTAALIGGSQLGQVEAYAMNDITSKRSQGRAERSNGIWIDSTITQQRDVV